MKIEVRLRQYEIEKEPKIQESTQFTPFWTKIPKYVQFERVFERNIFRQNCSTTT